MKFKRFVDGAVIIGHGWFLRVGKLRLVWAPAPDPKVTKVTYDTERTIKITVNWNEEGETP